ncbi:histidine kinase [Paludisphaera sp.]|uniref:PAS domain-containing sensor histidine kinase n=1 Tax=Paludisphaera sp. TaxID=2017432 RepID=UPI00301C18EC
MDRDRREPAHGGTPPDPPGGGDHRLRYQELFEFAPECQLVSDASGIILEANQAAAALLRMPKDFLIGKPLGLILRGERRRFYASLHRLASGMGADEFMSRVGREGEGRDIRVRAQATPDASMGVALRWHLRDVTEMNRAERSRMELSRRLAAAEENERRRIARELHDQMGQELTGLTLGLKLIEGSLPDGSDARPRVQDLLGMVDRLGRMAHEIAVDLRPTALDDLGLAAALENLAERWSRRTGIPVDILVDPEPTRRCAAEVETAVYRIAQESLTNIARHAGASRASLILERRDGQVVAIIEDDGRGFDLAAGPAAGRLGLLGMEERAQLLGGSLQVESSAGVGTTVRARIPREPQPPGGQDV